MVVRRHHPPILPCRGAKREFGGPGGTWTPYLNAHKPVLNAEYIEDGETTSQFCPADHAAGIYGALFTNALDGSYYQVCWNSQSQP